MKPQSDPGSHVVHAGGRVGGSAPNTLHNDGQHPTGHRSNKRLTSCSERLGWLAESGAVAPAIALTIAGPHIDERVGRYCI